MEQLEIDVIQDGMKFDDALVEKYRLYGKDFKYTYSNEDKKNIYYSNFVGIVRSDKEDTILLSMPKHYMNIKSFNGLSEKKKLMHIRRIIKSIDKTIYDSEYTQYKHSKDVEGSFSFESYNAIYSYYQTYGLYHDKEYYLKKGYGGHIEWKKTISKSNKYLINGKLVMIPLLNRKKYQHANIITECMIFVFNYTRKVYGYFMELPNTDEVHIFGINKNILNNINGTINKLLKVRAEIFKDNEKKLVDNLILFLKRVNSVTHKTKQSIKDYQYEYVWEKAVESYLNNNFNKFSNGNLIYSDEAINRYKFQKHSEHYDEAHPSNSMEPDHYYYDKKNNELYLFDSKYYVNLDSLNYKQLIYHILFKNRTQATTVYNALIMPTEEENNTRIHVKVLPDFLREEEEVIIYLHELNTVTVIKQFIK